MSYAKCNRTMNWFRTSLRPLRCLINHKIATGHWSSIVEADLTQAGEDKNNDIKLTIMIRAKLISKIISYFTLSCFHLALYSTFLAKNETMRFIYNLQCSKNPNILIKFRWKSSIQYQLENYVKKTDFGFFCSIHILWIMDVFII